MDTRTVALDVIVALAAGLVATRVNDRAQKVFYELTPDSEKAREPCAEPTSLVAARKTAATIGLKPTRRELMRLKQAIHYGLGAGWGVLYALLRRRSHMNPFAAGVVTGSTLSLFIDETLCPTLGLSEPNSHYPASSHLRGFVTHLVYGLALAGSAEVLYRLAAPARRPDADGPPARRMKKAASVIPARAGNHLKHQPGSRLSPG
jgi:uncharacterized membrane protein YagU involved in acid resistance